MKNKKFFAGINTGAVLILSASILQIFFGHAVFAQDTLGSNVFTDVQTGSKYFGALSYLKSRGVVSGYKDGTFKPENKINRAEALKVILIASGENLATTAQIFFSDVSSSDWFYDYVRRAYEIKLAQGYDDGTFRPEANINLAESLKIALVAFKSEVPESVTEKPFPDVETSYWYSRYAYFAKIKQFVSAEDDGMLHAEKIMTRGEFAEIVYRIMYIKDQNLLVFPLSINWPTHKNGFGHYSIQAPFNWIKMDAGTDIIFWKKDTLNRQVSFYKIYPESATLVTSVYENKENLDIDSYLGTLKYEPGAVITKSDLNGYPFANVIVAGQGVADFFLKLPSGAILAGYSTVGSGLLQSQLLEEIRYMIGSIRYDAEIKIASITDRDLLLSRVRGKILVKGAGGDALALFRDLLLFETDTIGIGTGPVDYYYSKEYDVTLKFERNSKTLLAIKDGKSSAF